MNNDELDMLLKSAAVPEHPPEFWAELPQRIAAKIHWQAQRSVAQTNEPRGFDFLNWAIGSAVVAVVLGITFLLQPGAASRATASRLVRAEKCYREVEAMFPNQVQAIIFDEHGPRVVLSEKADVPNSPPVYLRICGPRGCQEVVTFSGQRVQVNGDVCDVLLDSAGNVLIVGQQAVWSSSDLPGRDAGQRIEARALKAAS
jgi:hypothetical protein